MYFLAQMLYKMPKHGPDQVRLSNASRAMSHPLDMLVVLSLSSLLL